MFAESFLKFGDVHVFSFGLQQACEIGSFIYSFSCVWASDGHGAHNG